MKIGIKPLLNARGNNIMLHTKCQAKMRDGAGCSGVMQLLSFTRKDDFEKHVIGSNPQAM